LRQHPQARILLALTVICLIWGSTWLAIRINVQDTPPLRAAGLRFILAGLLLAVVAGRRRLPARERPGTLYWLGLAMAMITLPYACVYWGEQHISSGLTAVLFATYPLFVTLMAQSGRIGERITLPLLAGLALGLAGVTLLFWGQMGVDGTKSLAGGLLILLSALSSAVGTIMVKRRLAHLDPFLINLRPMLYGGLALMAVSLASEGGTPWTWTLRSTAALLYLALFGSAVAFSIYFWLMRTLPVSRLSFIVYVTPILALFLGSLVEHEPMTWNLMVGALLVLSGITMARRAP
jgi:drug/metabolite transporter (DMT)-like permease